MLSGIFFLINAIEAIVLAIYMFSIESSAQERIFFNLSVSRLAIVTGIFLIGLVFLYLAVRSLFGEKKLKTAVEKLLDSESTLWLSLAFSALLIFTALFLLTRQMDFFGNFKLIYQRLEPILAWMAVFGTQTLLISLIWYSAYFIGKEDKKSVKEVQKELLPLIGLYAAFVIIKLVFVTATSFGPVGRGDEMTYYTMADSFYYGIFSPRDYNHYQYPPLYPLSIVITLVFKGWAFEGVKLINVLLSSSIIFPVYFISRKFLDARKSLIAAFLSCLIPYHLVFPRRIVSENLFFPLFFWTMFITNVVPTTKRYRLLWDLTNGLMVGLLYLTRYITLATIPFFMLAWWVKPFDGEKSFFKPGLKKIIHMALFAVILAITFSPWVYAGIKTGVPAKLMFGFGIAARTTTEQLTATRLLTWAALYAFYFILVAAPVFNLLIISLKQIDIKNWRNGSNRWIWQVLLIMGGFYAAVTRHSWRAYYNREIPSAIMGRYLIVFSVLFFIIGLTALSKFKKNNFPSMEKFILLAQILPFVLVLIAYLALIKGVIFPTDGDLIKSHGSVDAFYIEILDGYFLLLVFVIYAITNWLMWKGKNKLALKALVFSLVLYFAAGIPSYYQNLLDYQTYPWLASRIARLAPQPNPKSGASESFTVFLPKKHDPENGDEIFNGLYTRGFENTVIETDSDEAVDMMTTSKGFIIKEAGKTENEDQSGVTLKFNNHEFVIIPVEK